MIPHSAPWCAAAPRSKNTALRPHYVGFKGDPLAETERNNREYVFISAQLKLWIIVFS